MELEEIMAARCTILNQLNKENKKLSDLAMERDYFVTSIAVEMEIEGKKQTLYFLIVDPTCKQKDHVSDIQEYSLQIYQKFAQKAYLV